MRSTGNTESPTDQSDKCQCRRPGTTGRAVPAHGAMTPRLFDLEQAATYLGLSPWTVRDLEAKGVLPRVRVPLPGGGELRKLLFDKADLDRLIERWKEEASQAFPHDCRPAR
jgi:Helix-turn-helix domain